jgi:ADP-heptose:LPS heptosyltransferase
MHLLETYAILSGTTIDKCFIEEEHIELPTNPFITLHSHNPKGSNRQYKYWNNVIADLKSVKNFNYDIIQIGGPDDIKSMANTYYLGKTNYHSLAYIIKHSSLHMGFDSLPVHLASHYNKKMVVLYAHYARNTRPYFSNDKDVVLLEPDHSIIKPVFGDKDPFDQINTINHNLITNNILKLLGLQ